MPDGAPALTLPDTIRLLLTGSDRVLTTVLEEYLPGVIAHEMAGEVPFEALKAQAVAARSYAAFFHRYPRHIGADVCDTTHCQVWRPAHPSELAIAAVQATRGEVIMWGGAVAAGFYHGNCGGTTRDAHVVWGVAAPWCAPVACPVEGGAYDHGVGLCQRGAVKMAQGGAGYREILEHYFTGVEIERA